MKIILKVELEIPEAKLLFHLNDLNRQAAVELACKAVMDGFQSVPGVSVSVTEQTNLPCRCENSLIF